MQSIWLSLLWKEWCEFRWKLAALTGSFVAGQVTILWAYFFDHPVEIAAQILAVMISACLFLYGALAGSFVGMTVAAGENSHRTMRFARALPVQMWQVGLVRILVATLTVVLPIVAVGAVSWLFVWFFWNDPQRFNDIANLDNQRYPWGIQNYLLGHTVASILGVSSLLWWVAACGVNRSDEVRAGAVAFLVSALLWFVTIYLTEENIFIWHDIQSRNPMETLSVALPAGPAFSANFGYRPLDKSIPLLALIAFVSHALVLTFFLKRYGRPTSQASAGRQFFSDWLSIRTSRSPFRSQAAAIVWRQIRETAPLALLAIGGVFAFVAFTYFADDPRRWQLRDWGNMLGALALTVGAFVTMVAGIAVLYEDYSRGLPNFWRSRPINLHQWFFLKFATGLLVLICTFGPLLLFANWLTGWSFPRDDIQGFVMWFTLVYTTSLAAYAVIRQPIYAVVLSLAAFFTIPLMGQFLQPIFERHFGFRDEQLMYLLGWTMTTLATLLAWQAVVRDWGWKQHR